MNTTTQGIQNDKRAAWFDDLISTLRSHEVQLETDLANPELKKFYEDMMSENHDEVFRMTKMTSQRFFVRRIILEYVRMLGEKMPRRLAFDYSDSEVLVWAEIEDNDEQMERNLTLAEAKINAQFHPFGYDMESMIVEVGDGLTIPNHYKIFK